MYYNIILRGLYTTEWDRKVIIDPLKNNDQQDFSPRPFLILGL
jgi:hypothetical protein